MTYDNWKCTDPNDQWLDEEPMSEEEKQTMFAQLKQNEITLQVARERFKDGDISLSELGEVYLDCGYHPYQIRQILSRHAQFPIPKGSFGREG